jgi:hypothetical protein
MMRIYVSGASNELDRARRAMRMLEARGARVAIDWTVEVERLAHDGLTTASMTDTNAREAAELNTLALRSSDALLFLAPRGTSRDAWVELGVALELGIDVAVAGSAARHSISTRLAPCFETDEDAITWLLGAEQRSAEETAS